MISEQISEIESQITYLRNRCDALANEFKECFAEASRLRPSLEAIESEADEEAREMKQLFAEANGAYSSGDGESAKAFSIEGREHKSRCEALNEQAQALRDQIRSFAEQGKQKQAECESLNAEVVRLIERKRSLIDQSRRLSVSGNSLVIGDKIQIEKGRLEILTRRFSNLSWNQAQALREIFSNSKVDYIVLAWGLSNPELNDDIATEIPEAIADIFRTHPEVAGMFSPLSTRGLGAKAWIRGLSNTNPHSAMGTAYEVLATRKLMYESAGTLKIHSTDQLAFGPKLQARYIPNDFKINELLGSLSNIAPDRWARLRNNPNALARQTVESDIALGRPRGFAGTEEIFVDFKHTSGNARSLDPAVLLGVAVAIATGEIDEAHFVCNAGLSGGSQQRIKDINQVLNQWGCSGTINGQEYFSF